MIDASKRKQILKAGKPQVAWSGEPLLGSVYGEEEIQAAVDAMRSSTEPTVGFGFTAEPIVAFEKAFADYCGTKHAIAVNSAGPGLDMAMRYLEMKPGDEVIVPAINFQASPLAVYGAGGQVVWGDIDEMTLQLDPADVAAKITPRTRAIFPVHFNGLSAPMDELIEVAGESIPVIGDGARALGGGYKGEKIGKRGFANVFSLHTMKNITTLGEGGMITTDDDTFAAYCRSVRFYGQAVEAWGTSNVMTKVQAAVGLVQLGRLDDMIDARRRLARQRHEYLDGIDEIALPIEPEDCRHSFYVYTCVARPDWAGAKRDAVMKMMQEQFGVRLVVANAPVYQTRRLLREHTAGQSLPRSDDLGRRLFCLPIHPRMSDEDNAYLSAALIECVERLR